MVSRIRVLFCVVWLAAGSQALASLPDYHLGDIVQTNIIAPAEMVVVDPAETVAQKAREAGREPVYCRYYTNALIEAETELHTAFSATRASFLDALEAAYQRRTLTSETLDTSQFRNLVASFAVRPAPFPVSLELARLWARGASDQAVQDSLIAVLRRTMGQPVRPDGPVPPSLNLRSNVRLVPLGDWNERATLQTAMRNTRSVPRGGIVTLARARQMLQEALPPEAAWAKPCLTSLLRTNCIPDEALTREGREKRADSVWAADRYEAGQVIARQGQVVDSKIKAALDQLREKSAAALLEQKITAEQSLPTRRAAAWIPWAAAGLGALAMSLAIIGWRVVRPRPARSLLPARMAGSGSDVAVVSCPACATNIVVPGDEQAALRASVAPHLARLLMDKLVRKLLAQRSGLLDTQQQAAAEMAQLEARLEMMQAPLQERLRAYEQRILELERELAQKGEENRELIKMEIALARTQLAATRGKLDLN
jgi:hypothetical protein